MKLILKKFENEDIIITGNPSLNKETFKIKDDCWETLIFIKDLLSGEKVTLGEIETDGRVFVGLLSEIDNQNEILVDPEFSNYTIIFRGFTGNVVLGMYSEEGDDILEPEFLSDYLFFAYEEKYGNDKFPTTVTLFLDGKYKSFSCV